LVIEYAQFRICSPGFSPPKAQMATDVAKVREALGGKRIAAPSGFTVQMDGQTHHLYKPVMIGRITDDGRIVPVSVTEGCRPILGARGLSIPGRSPVAPWRNSPAPFHQIELISINGTARGPP
jgi:hypothetical protein